jgi:hypothetical protein
MKKMECMRLRKGAAVLGHNDVRMKAKMNRYDLSLWDVGKRSLYGREEKASKSATLAGGFMEWTWRLHINQDGIKRGGVAQVGKFF